MPHFLLGNKSWGLKQLEEGFLLLSSLRSPLCATLLLTYHTLISYVVGAGDGDLDFAQTILNKVRTIGIGPNALGCMSVLIHLLTA